MSLLFTRQPPTKRDAFPYPDIPTNAQAGSWIANGTGPATTEGALRKVAVFASVNLIAGMSRLPLDGYTGTGLAKREVGLPAFFLNPDGSGQGIADWLYQVLFSALLRGNAVGEIAETDSQGRPTQVVLWHPDLVSLQETPKGPVWRHQGRVVPTEKVWHRRAYPVPGCRLGLSPIALEAATIGEGLAATAFGLRWFTDGAHPSAILTQKDAREIEQSEARTIKDRFLAAVRGTREPVVLSGGWEYTPIQISAEESQFLDTQKYTASECARIFGPGVPEILGYEVGGPLTYTTPELRSIDLLKYTLDRWLVWCEKFLSEDFLPTPRYVKFNRAALLATDALTRFKVHQIALDNRIETVNEVRDIEDMAPVAWGDEPNDLGTTKLPTVKVEEP